MKRPSTTDGQSPPENSSSSSRPKRSKTSQACDSCRKHKTRCELPSGGVGLGRCHRCNVLQLPCSFEGTEPVRATSPGGTTSMAGPTKPQSVVIDRGPSKHDPQALTAEELVIGPRLLSGEEPGAGPGYWAAAPMGAIWDIMRRRSAEAQSVPIDPTPTNEVLSADQIQHLMNIFNKDYVPWMNMTHLRTSPGSPYDLSNFLVLACCAVACRHLPGDAGVRAQGRLQQMAEHAVLLRTFDPIAHASLDGVQALVVLATWSPAIGAVRADVQDGSLIATGAVKMAQALKLDQCSEPAVNMRAKARVAGEMAEEDKPLYEELMWKTRLWAAICNTEWHLCTGTSRNPISVRSTHDHQALDWRMFPGASTEADARDFRLGISAQVLEATAKGLNKPFHNLQEFFTEIQELMTVFNHARNVCQPLRWTFPLERLHMDVLYFQQWAGRLLVLFHALAQIRASMGAHIKERPWMLELEQSGVRFVKQWGIEILHAAQSVLECFFDIVDRYENLFGAGSPHTPGSGMPSPMGPGTDAFYATVLFAASILLVSRYTMFLQFAIRDSVFLHTAAKVLQKLAVSLAQRSLGPEHAPRKAAAVVHELQRVWHDKVIAKVAEDARQPLNMGGPYVVHMGAYQQLSAQFTGNTGSGAVPQGEGSLGAFRLQQDTPASSSSSDSPAYNHSSSSSPQEERERERSQAYVGLPMSAERTSASMPEQPGQQQQAYSNGVPSNASQYDHPMPTSQYSYPAQPQQQRQPQAPTPLQPPQQSLQQPSLGEQFWNWTGTAPVEAWDFSLDTDLNVPMDPQNQFFPALDPGQLLDSGFWNVFMNDVDMPRMGRTGPSGGMGMGMGGP